MKKTINNYIFYIIVFGIIGMILEIVYIRIMPTSHWFKMESVEPSSDTFLIGEKPTFKTTAEYKKAGHITWEDIQYCKFGEDYVYTSYYKTSTYNEPKIVVSKEWLYNIEGPLVPADCYLYNITSIELHYGLKKSQTILSGPYRYLDYNTY